MIKTIKYLTFLSLITLCVILGLWQVDRGNEKKDIYNSYINKLSNGPIDLNILSNEPGQFTNVIIQNSSFRYLSKKQFLLDNKVNNHQAGYEVLTPIKVDKKILLVNRGWVTNHNRQRLPNINIIDSKSNLEGYIYYYADAYELEKDTYQLDFPMVIQNIKLDDISKILDSDVLPYVLILSKKQDNAYAIQSRYQENPELKHYMYAGQWFLFALIGFIFMIILMRKVK